jgi:trehalose 6-phosphate synthase
MNLVVVSNRVARAKANEPMTGGLAAALLPVVEKSGAIWVGSSGRLSEGRDDGLMEIESLGSGALAMLDLPTAHYGGYYQGFANSALWPALHSRSDLIRVSSEDYRSYCEVNAFVARALLRFRKPDTAYWIQDYHFLALGAEMRSLGVTQPIGFFLHTPWPSRAIAARVPYHSELIESMLAYDLIGFQTEEDRTNFSDYIQRELGLEVDDEGMIASRHGLSRLAVFPIGIDVDGFANQAAKAITHPDVSRLRLSLRGERLAIGVDRIDYSKGLVNRVCSFDRLLEMHPALKRSISLLQIATPSRGGIEAYERLQIDLASLVTEVNGRHGEVDWTPIRYLSKGFSQQVLAGFYRSAQVGLVTPLQDGMNLVAKEYVAAQNPEDPGVLVLSRYAGAASELDAALIVNPSDIDGVAQAMYTALTMSILERRERWTAMMAKLKAQTIHQWFADFVNALEETPIRRAFTDVEPALVPAPGAACGNARVH